MSFEDKVKSSFEKVKEEMSLIKTDISSIKTELNELKESLTSLRKEISKLSIRNQPQIKPNFIPQFSIGNEGVPTNQQTNTPTDNTPLFPVDGDSSLDSSTSAHFPTHNPAHLQHITGKVQQTNTKTPQIDQVNDLNQLIDTLKTDLKKKFKSLTKQEFHIFSMLYTVDKSQNSTTYQDLAVRTGLTSSSIRDYIQRIAKKGIPIIKEKQNNKLVVLKIPQELKNLATLDSLMRLRKEFPDESLDQFTEK